MCEYWGAQAPSRDFRLGALFVVRWSLGVPPKDLWGEVMDDHEMWWSLRRLLYKQTMTFAETDIIRTWLHGFSKVLTIMKSKPWDYESQRVIDAFDLWYNRWWESGVFEKPPD